MANGAAWGSQCMGQSGWQAGSLGYMGQSVHGAVSAWGRDSQVGLTDFQVLTGHIFPLVRQVDKLLQRQLRILGLGLLASLARFGPPSAGLDTGAWGTSLADMGP